MESLRWIRNVETFTRFTNGGIWQFTLMGTEQQIRQKLIVCHATTHAMPAAAIQTLMTSQSMPLLMCRLLMSADCNLSASAS
jgi:hypothetical protein